MTVREIALANIKAALVEGDLHLSRLERAYALLHALFPMSETALQGLVEERMAFLDQFLYRFMKLQDAMGTRLLPAVYQFLQDERSPIPFLDILAALEKFGVITSEHDWQFFRNLRNNLAHDYPENAGQMVLGLNTLFANWARMRDLYLGVREYCMKKILS